MCVCTPASREHLESPLANGNIQCENINHRVQHQGIQPFFKSCNQVFSAEIPMGKRFHLEAGGDAVHLLCVQVPMPVCLESPLRQRFRPYSSTAKHNLLIKPSPTSDIYGTSFGSHSIVHVMFFSFSKPQKCCCGIESHKLQVIHFNHFSILVTKERTHKTCL